jgi:transcriptional regulator with XRE-family HTH domain
MPGVSSGKRTAEEIFGERLRQLRVERGISQEKLAELAGLHRNYIGHLERGEKTASLDVIVRLSATFDTSVTELLKPFDHHTTRSVAIVAFRRGV